MRWLVGVLVVLLAAVSALGYTRQQAARGKQTFERHCALCHGREGHGGTVPQRFAQHAGMPAPPLTGPGALPGMRTAGQVHEFIKQNMPLDKPGSLAEQDYLDLVAFTLQANGVARPDTRPLTPEAAKGIRLRAGGR
jgi:cytochrome c